MKRMIWKSLGSLLLCLSFLSVYAKEDLVLHLKSGGQITFTLEENPVITFEGENMLVKSKTVNYSVPMGDIDSYDFVTREDPVTITAKDSTIKYGDKIPTFEFTSKGAALEGTPSITCRATKVVQKSNPEHNEAFSSSVILEISSFKFIIILLTIFE